ncbi:MAG: VOC family protein [Bacteroidetes bacterium]|nr:VOC family protein [Bacteroidota bacterium]
MTNILNWFEIPVTNMERALQFYETVLSIKFKRQQTLGYDMALFPTETNMVTGALICGEGYKPTVHGSLIYLNANPDLNITLSKVENNGGQVLVSKTLIDAQSGYFAFILDTEGNKVALHSNQ